MVRVIIVRLLAHTIRPARPLTSIVLITRTVQAIASIRQSSPSRHRQAQLRSVVMARTASVSTVAEPARIMAE